MNLMFFPHRLCQLLDAIQPDRYAQTRNYTNGAVTRLSPFISRGVISTAQVLQFLVNKGYRWPELEMLCKELAWRDYFQRLWQHHDLENEVKQPQHPVQHHGIPRALVQAQTGIHAIDNAIRQLYATGYLHNHLRMYIASITCHSAQAHWKTPARWMYYYLLDGDWGSNAASWQWVCGSNSSKKYWVNQENINRYTGSTQRGTYLDYAYEDLPGQPVPEHLKAYDDGLMLCTQLPATPPPRLNPAWPVCVYTYYNLDAQWQAGENVNRVLLLDTASFERYPVSENCIRFVLELADHIPGVQVWTGSFDALAEQTSGQALHYKEHPLCRHYRGVEEPREWLAPEVTGMFPSFFAYWKKAEPRIREKFNLY